MTAPDLSPAEVARVAEFDAAVEPAEVTREKLRLAEEALARVREIAADLDGFVEARGLPANGSFDHALNRAQAAAAADIRTAVDGR